MKNHILVLLFSLLASACHTDTTSPTPDPSGSDTTYKVVVEYDNRTYTPCEQIAVSVTVEGRNTTAETFPFYVVASGGDVSVTLDGEVFSQATTYELPYSVINANHSMRTLNFSITPLPSGSTEQLLTISFRVVTADGNEILDERRAVIETSNPAEIQADVAYDPTPLEIEQLLSLTLRATKESYLGEFRVFFKMQEGEGKLIVNGRQYSENSTFSITAGDTISLQYQPSSVGMQCLTLTLSDGVSSVDLHIEIEVYNQGGVSSPPNGVYIYTKEGFYYTVARWSEAQGQTPEGVAVIASENRFLLGMTSTRDRFINPAEYKQYGTLPHSYASTLAEAVSDFNGKKNTEILIAAVRDGILTEANAATWCYNYDSRTPGIWYIPSSGQLHLITKHFIAVQECLRAIGGTPFNTHNYYLHHYLSSTPYRNTTVWAAYYNRETYNKPEDLIFYTAGIDVYYDYNFYYPVRDL